MTEQQIEECMALGHLRAALAILNNVGLRSRPVRDQLIDAINALQKATSMQWTVTDEFLERAARPTDTVQS